MSVASPVSVEKTLQHNSSTLFFAALLPFYTIFPQDARTALTALFLALLALFSSEYHFQITSDEYFLTLFVAMAYAAPIAPQGAILNRQCSMAGGCRDAVGVGNVCTKKWLADWIL